MSPNTALAVSVGVLGAIATWLFLGPLGGALAIWAAFIAWGCYFHCGGKEQGLQSAILNNAAGAVIAGLTLIVGAAYTLWLVKRVLFGEVANEQVAQLKDLEPREAIVLGSFAIAVLALGIWPAPLTDLMGTSIDSLVAQITQAKA